MYRVALFVGLVLAVAVASVAAEPFHANIAGACTNKDDFSFTGAPLFNGETGAVRISCALTGTSTHGCFTATLLSEAQVTTTPCTQPDGGSGIETPPQGELVVLTFNTRNDQLFLRLTSGTQCQSLATGLGVAHTTTEVIGGTGRFAGATGTLDGDNTTLVLGVSALGPSGFFTNYTGTLQGSISLNEK